MRNGRGSHALDASRFLTDLFQRLRRKVVGMIPIIAGALAFSLVLSLVIYLVAPLLPASYRQAFDVIRGGDWEEGRRLLSELVDGFGAAKPYAYVALQVAQVLFAPIPGQVIGLLGGYFFGFWQGLFLSMAGLVAGSLTAMSLARLLGEKVVRRFVPAGIFEKFDHLVKGGGLWNFFMLFLLPALPDDAICFMAGLTRWRLSHLLAVSALGRLPGTAVLVFVGSSVGRDMRVANVLLAVATVAALALWLYSDEAEAYFYRLSAGGRGRKRDE